MASNLHLSATARNAMLDALNAVVGSGAKLKIYSGTQPANVAAALSGNTLLAQLSLATTPFLAAASGVVAADTISSDTSADATGTAVWGSITKSDDTRVIDFSVGTSGTDCIINTTAIVAGAVVSVSSCQFNIGA